MDKPRVTPKDFFLWAGAMLALYVSVVSFISLFFEYINRGFPDQLDSYVDPYSGSIRFAIASLIVLFPLFLVLMRIIRRDIARDQNKRDIWVRRWALYLTVFIAGAAVAIDLITLINSFLGGDITTRFVLKIAIVLLVAGAGFLHFLSDIRGYWEKQPRRAAYVGYAAGLVVFATIVSGFFIMGTPNDVRGYRFDDRKVQDLTGIQYRIVDYWQAKKAMPNTLTDLNDSVGGYSVPSDPQTGASYEYGVITGTTFKLCAQFNAVSQNPNLKEPMARPAVPLGTPGSVTDLAAATWDHTDGRYCFVRTIDPQRYPPLSNGKVVK